MIDMSCTSDVMLSVEGLSRRLASQSGVETGALLRASDLVKGGKMKRTITRFTALADGIEIG